MEGAERTSLPFKRHACWQMNASILRPPQVISNVAKRSAIEVWISTSPNHVHFCVDQGGHTLCCDEDRFAQNYLQRFFRCWQRLWFWVSLASGGYHGTGSSQTLSVVEPPKFPIPIDYMRLRGQ